MLRPYGRLLLFQGLLALAGSSAGAFFGFFFLDRGLVLELLLALALGFATAAAGSAAMTLRPLPSHAAMALGAFLYGLEFPLLIILPSPWGAVAAGLGWGFAIPLFFLPLNTLAADMTSEKDRAVKLGGLFLAFTAVGIIGPTLGGFLIFLGGYALCFAFGAIVLAVDSALLLLWRRDGRAIAFRLDFRTMGGRACAGSLFQGGMEGALGLAVAMAVFGFVQDETTIGFLLSAFALFGGITTVILARVSDRVRHRRRFLVAGALLAAAGLAGVSVASDLTGYFVASSLMQLAFLTAPLFLFAMVVDRFEGRHADGIATREVLLNSGRVVGVTAAAAVFFLTGSPLLAFTVAAVSAAGMAVG